MSVEKYQNNNFYPAQGNIGHNGTLINSSLPGNRIIQHSDGTIELLPKQPGVFLGEQIYNLTVGLFNGISYGMTYVDSLLTRAFSVLPIVSANPEKSTYLDVQECLKYHFDKLKNFESLSKLTSKEKALEVIASLYRSPKEKCFEKINFELVTELYDQYLCNHEISRKKLEDLNYNDNQYFYFIDEGLPEIFMLPHVEIMQIDETHFFEINKWVAIEGHMGWIKFAKGWLYDYEVERGGYNYDFSERKRSILSRFEIEHLH